MILQLSQLPQLSGPQGDGYHGQVPLRARFLAPDAAASLLALERESGGLVYTDLYRSPAECRNANRGKPGTLPAGFSAHDFGLAIDLEVSATLAKLGVRYPELVEWLADRGWFCHRRDLDATASESWHFNWLGTDDPQHYLQLAMREDHRTWKEPVELRIQERCGGDFRLTVQEVQAALANPAAGEGMPIYTGAIDGIVGDNTVAAIRAFQDRWDLSVDGVAGPKTQRVLAVVTAQTQLS